MVTLHFYPSLGGMEKQLRGLARGLQQRGYAVDVVTARFAGLPAYGVVDGLPVYRNGCLNARNAFSHRHLLTYMATLAAFLWRHRCTYDIIHIQQALHAALVGVAMGKLLGKPTLVKVTGSGAVGNLKWHEQLRTGSLIRAIVRRADAIISLSAESTAELAAAGITHNVMTIPNGVDITSYGRAAHPGAERARLGLPEQGPIVLFMNRLAAEKGLDTLLQAWSELTDADAQLVIAGEGPARDEAVRLAEVLGICRSVSFIGRVADVPAYLAAADIFVLPSYSEGISNALLEAMAAGLPCVASEVGGNLELIRPGENGLLFPAGNAGGLAAQLRRALNDCALAERLGAEARRTVETGYSMDSVVDRYVALYERLLHEG